jgi:four helix bundle protein
MAKITRFEDLKCWQAARQLVREVYKASVLGELAKDFDTKSQFRRAALSSMNNIAEGFGRFGRKDFIRFLDTAQSSVLEVESMLYVLEDLDYLPVEKIKFIRERAVETKALTLALIRYLRNKDKSQ